ncbi:MAG: hypothetical protein WBX38_03010 [Candidatus Sulfotelmatobacter sp.]
MNAPRTLLQDEIIRFLQNPEDVHDLPEIVKKFRTLADDASIKATLLMLNVEGLVEITPNWEFRGAAPNDARA